MIQCCSFACTVPFLVTAIHITIRSTESPVEVISGEGIGFFSWLKNHQECYVRWTGSTGTLRMAGYWVTGHNNLVHLLTDAKAKRDAFRWQKRQATDPMAISSGSQQAGHCLTCYDLRNCMNMLNMRHTNYTIKDFAYAARSIGLEFILLLAHVFS